MKELPQVEDSSKVLVVPLTEKWFEAAKVSTANKEHLLKSLVSLIHGRAPTPSFKLYGSSDKSIVSDFLNSIHWNEVDVPKGWKEYEFDRLSKYGPQGGYRPWDEISDLFHLYQERLRPCTVDLATLNDLKKCYGSVFCQMLQADRTLANLLAKDKIQSRAAGCRDFALKKTDPVAQYHAVHDFKSGLESKFFMYTFSRYYKNKIRLFMPGPFSSMINQARYVVPFLEAIQNDIELNRSKSLLRQHADKIGFDKCFDIMTDEINNAMSFSSLGEWTFIYVQGDFEKMDTTEGTDQYISTFIPLMAQSFRFSEKSFNYQNLSQSMLLTTTMPIASPEGMMVGEHGTGSGMENTNIGEGCSNDYYQVRMLDILKRLVKELVEYIVCARRVNGDDSCIVFAVRTKDSEILARFKSLIQQSAQEAADECGFRINEKWRMDENFGLYCQNGFWYDIKERKVKWMYPSALILNSIINPEHQYSKSEWDKDYRDIDIVEKLDNGRNLPYFHELVNFVDNGMKYRLLRNSEKETYRILSKWDKYRALQSLSERYNRQEYNISNSPTVNYLLKIRH